MTTVHTQLSCVHADCPHSSSSSSSSASLQHSLQNSTKWSTKCSAHGFTHRSAECWVYRMVYSVQLCRPLCTTLRLPLCRPSCRPLYTTVQHSPLLLLQIGDIRIGSFPLTSLSYGFWLCLIQNVFFFKWDVHLDSLWLNGFTSDGMPWRLQMERDLNIYYA